MRSKKVEEIEELLQEIRGIYGSHSVESYGDCDDPTSAGFRVREIPATFAVIVGDRLPARHFNVQIESSPPGDYLYHDPAMSYWEFLELVGRFSGPRSTWPTMK